MEIESAGTAREFWYHIPATETDKPMPLVILLHPEGSNGIRMVNRGGFLAHSDLHGYAVAAPNAIGNGFDYKGSDGTRHQPNEDIQFLEAMVKTLTKNPAIDNSRVYLVGFSTGATMAFRAAMESNLELAGLAAVAGLPPMPLAEALPTIPTMFIFGDSDPGIPLKGIKNESGWQQYPPKKAFKDWARKMDCSIAVSSTIQFVRHTKRSGCRDNISVVYVQVGNLGHHWPRPRSSMLELIDPANGPFQAGLDATSVIWDFFEKAEH